MNYVEKLLSIWIPISTRGLNLRKINITQKIEKYVEFRKQILQIENL